jgi:branched-chain amino acid transport system substrate-binding protein
MGRKVSLKTIASIGLVLALATTFLLAAPANGQVKTLKIGALLNLTGWYSVFDVIEYEDVKTVAQIINERGGITIKGQKYNIEIVAEDGKTALDGITAAATRLAYDRRVKFVVGPNGFFATGSSPVFEANKILHVNGYCTHQPGELDSSTPYGFLGYGGSVGTCIASLKAMKKEFPNVKKIAIVTPDDGAIPYMIPAIRKVIQFQGYTVVGDTIGYSNTLVDMNPIATKLNAIKDADAYLHQNGAPQSMGGIVKGLRELGDYKPYIASIPMSCKDALTIAGKEASTNVITLGFAPNAADNPSLVNEIFNKGRKQLPLVLAIPDALWVLARVIDAAQSLDPDVVKAKWESMDKVDTLFGTGIIGGTQTYGIKNHALSHPFPYEKLVDGQIVYGGWVEAGHIP